MSSYPDDIRSYDHDIRSPFHPDCGPSRNDNKCHQCRQYVDECECDEQDERYPLSMNDGKMPQTTAERVRKHNEARKARKISLDGDALDRLAAYQEAKGLSSRSAALRHLLTLAGF